MKKKTIFIGSDHGGYKLKNELEEFLTSSNIRFFDIGSFSEESCDYPDIAKILCKHVSQGSLYGILICGTGIGISIAANKIKGIRCALCYNKYTAEMARKHNDANVLALGGRTTKLEDAIDIVNIFLTEKFEGGRHLDRIKKIEDI